MRSTGHRAADNGLRKKACAPCRTRRIRCNRMQPCNNCMVRGLRCLPSEQSPGSSSTSTPTPPSSSRLRNAITAPGDRTRKAGFHRFVSALDIYLSNLAIRTDVYHWRHGVIPAAATHESIMNAVLCKEIINNLSKDQHMSTALPAKAIEYYVDSLSRPFTRLEDLPLLLIVSLLYIEVEWVLAHYQNLDILVQSTLRILHSNIELIRSRYFNDRLVYSLICQLMEHVTETAVDVSAIPMETWTELHSFMLKYARKMQADGLMLMELRLYELNFLSQRSDFDAPTFRWKLAVWDHEMAQLQRIHKGGTKDAMWMDIQIRRVHPAKLFWIAYLYFTSGGSAREQELRSMVEDSTAKVEMLLKAPWVNSPDKIRIMNIQVFCKIIPRIAIYVSYSRDVAICRRLLNVLKVFRPCIPYYNELADYLMKMAETEFGQHTALEFAYFGSDLPLILWRWQISRVVDQVASHGFTELLKARSLPVIQPKVIA